MKVILDRKKLAWNALLVSSVLLFWKFRVIDSALSWFTISNLDIFVSQQPMTQYAVESIRAGRLPLWNPHQLCGLPFMAIPYVGLFYLPNAVYLAGTALGFELSYVLHMSAAAIATALLVRALGLPWAAGLTAALTYCWSGRLIDWVSQPFMIAGLAWMPITVLAVEKVVRGSRAARLGLAVAVAFQIFNGASEVFLHTMYVAGAYALFRLTQLALDTNARAALALGVTLLVWVIAGVALSAVQLLPTLELVLESVRGPGELELAEIMRFGSMSWSRFGHSIASGSDVAAVGALGVLAVFIGADSKRQRWPWIFALVSGAIAVLLANGGFLYSAYTELPVGALFRRPVKFLTIYGFAQALLCGLAVARLHELVGTSSRATWRYVGWWLGLAVGTGAALALIAAGEVNLWLFGLIGLLVLFGLLPAGKPRRVALAAVVALQVSSVFAGSVNRNVRPWHFPTFLSDHAERVEVDKIRQILDGDRLYISRRIQLMKLGMYSDLLVVNDYEPLTPIRYAEYFELASGEHRAVPFNGKFELNSDSRLALLDLAGVRLYLFPGLIAPERLRSWVPESAGLRRHDTTLFQLYERDETLPRAFFIDRARSVADGAAALAAVAEERFDPRREVVLEVAAETVTEIPDAAARFTPATIHRYEAERVEVRIEAPTAGYLVLTDFHYPGWKATVDGREVPILRANHLFRAVRIDAGRRAVEFRYEPLSFRVGSALTFATALCMALITGWWRFHPRAVGSPNQLRPDAEQRG